MSTRAPVGTAIAGPVAEEALAQLVLQFSERTAFVRELIQNSLDAGAGRVDLLLEARGEHLLVTVTDDGEGMDRATIEDQLLTLFRSAKEHDLTKIGKFGVGFVSVFATGPDAVVVDTGRDGVHLRLVFDAARRYTLAEVDEPFEGTAVRLHVPVRGEARDAVHYWCRYARAELRTEGRAGQESWGWPEEAVVHPFTVDAAVTVTDEGDGFRAVLGLWPEREAPVGYYNRGHTLLEAREAAVPGRCRSAARWTTRTSRPTPSGPDSRTTTLAAH